MKNTCQSCCERDGELVRVMSHTKLGTAHVLSMDKEVGLIPAMFEAAADYVAGDSFVLNCEEYIVVPQDGNAVKAGFFRKGALVSVLVDTEGKCLGFTSGNGVKRLPDSAEGHLLVGGPDGEPADSGKTVEDFDPAGSAQAVQSGLDEHKADAVVHVTEAERVGWDNKADRAPDAVAGHLAALDERGNPVDSGKMSENFDPAGSAQVVRDELEGRISTIEAGLTADPLVWQLIPTASWVTNSIYCARDKLGLVHLRGYISKSAAAIPVNQVFATLPEGFRPTVFCLVSTLLSMSGNDIEYGDPAVVRIFQNGDMTLLKPLNNKSFASGAITFNTAFALI